MLRMRRSHIENGAPSARSWLGTDAKVVRHVRVCGAGHLAVATRIELARLGIQRDSDYLLPSLHPDLIIACADSESDQSFHSAAQRAVNEGSPLLFGCLIGRALRLGPLIDPSSYGATSERRTRPDTADVGLPADTSPTEQDPGYAQPIPERHSSEGGVAEADPSVSLYARLGAILISAQALSFLLGARNQCVRDRAIEFNPWSMESRAYRVLKVRQ